MQRFLNEKEVSERTSIPLQTLRNHRHRGVGFPYCKLTRAVRYPEKDIEEFLQRHRVETRDSIDGRSGPRDRERGSGR